MLKELNVNVHFALPYNAQTKPVERDFLKIKELLSKHFVGYRGGNVVERPEKLAKEIKDGKIMKFEDFKEIFDKTIINILNKRPSNGKNLNGRCPLRFIFSHSALKEGWDNPNVFQVCTLIEQKSTFTCRQKVGRGLRLCVNQDGERIEDRNINILHVMANESFAEFASTLQKEIEDETGAT